MMLMPPSLDETLRAFLSEDLGSGDITSNCLADEAPRVGWYVARKAGVICGLPIAARLFKLLGIESWQSLVEDGALVTPGTRVAQVQGPGYVLLQGERVSLNLLQRMSGIATKTRTMVDIAAQGGARITDTRKTAPGLRWFDKYAVRTGGGTSHRWGLYDAVLLKDNHIKLAGGIAPALKVAREASGHTVKIEIEVESLDQVREALAGRADIIMLDNMSPEIVRQAVVLIAGGAITEASGNIDEDNLAEYAATGVNYISMGALTHSIIALDIGFDLDTPKIKGGR